MFTADHSDSSVLNTHVQWNPGILTVDIKTNLSPAIQNPDFECSYIKACQDIEAV